MCRFHTETEKYNKLSQPSGRKFIYICLLLVQIMIISYCLIVLYLLSKVLVLRKASYIIKIWSSDQEDFLNHNKSFRWHLGDYEKHNFFHLKACERRNFDFCVFLRMYSGSVQLQILNNPKSDYYHTGPSSLYKPSRLQDLCVSA